MARKYRVKAKYVDGRYPHLRGVVFDESDINIIQDFGSMFMDLQTALDFEQMSYKERCEYIGMPDLDGQIISIGDFSDEYEYTEFDSIHVFEEVEDDNV
jgi:hypothetical protein